MPINNPFLDSYMKNEIKWYKLKEYEEGDVKVISKSITGRCDDYLNKNFRIGTPDTPILLLDGELWMSLSFMEIQSHWVPIRMAHGKCATGGLGLGYCALKMAAKPEVKSLDVYETEQGVIDFFNKSFSRRKGFKKINLIRGDVLETMKKKTYDFVYMDIYKTMCEDKAITDCRELRKNNDIYMYRYWCEEKVVCTARASMGMDVFLYNEENEFFRMWTEAQIGTGPKGKTLCDLYEPLYDDKYVRKCIRLNRLCLGRLRRTV